MTSQFKVEYDTEADAIYVRLKKGVVRESVELSKSIIVDINSRNQPVGIEFLNPSELGPFMQRHFPNSGDVSQAVAELVRVSI